MWGYLYLSLSLVTWLLSKQLPPSDCVSCPLSMTICRMETELAFHRPPWMTVPKTLIAMANKKRIWAHLGMWQRMMGTFHWSLITFSSCGTRAKHGFYFPHGCQWLKQPCESSSGSRVFSGCVSHPTSKVNPLLLGCFLLSRKHGQVFVFMDKLIITFLVKLYLLESLPISWMYHCVFITTPFPLLNISWTSF